MAYFYNSTPSISASPSAFWFCSYLCATEDLLFFTIDLSHSKLYCVEFSSSSSLKTPYFPDPAAQREPLFFNTSFGLQNHVSHLLHYLQLLLAQALHNHSNFHCNQYLVLYQFQLLQRSYLPKHKDFHHF